MKRLQQTHRKVTSLLRRMFNYRGMYIHWLNHDQVEDITEIVLSKEFEKRTSSSDIEY